MRSIFNDFGGFGGFGGFRLGGIMFTVVPIIVFLGFFLVLGLIIFRGIQGAKQWKRNNNSPVLTVDARIVGKRADVSHYHHNTGNDNISHTSSSTRYYVTFEVESGDRMELHVRDTEYGLLAENDVGKLTFQGTRYLGFERYRGGAGE